MKTILAVLLAVLVVGGISSVSAAQLSWDARTLESAFEPKFTFQKTITIDYADGGLIADELRGKQESVQFSADKTSKDVSELIEKLNASLAVSGSTSRITDLAIDYSAQLTGYDSYASIEYNVVLVPRIERFIIQEYSGEIPALFDISWRGLSISGPVTISGYEITKPISILEKKFPLVYQSLLGTEAESLLSESMLDASGIQTLGLAKWHSLFDPTSIVVDATKYGFKGEIITTFSMGTSDIFNPTREAITKINFVTDQKYRVSAFEATDNANLQIPGYASAGMLGKSEVIQTGPKPPSGTRPPSDKDQFPILVVYGMAGIAAAGAGGFFWWSSKKTKKDLECGQTGIDPAYLLGTETSAASGSYKTNRGEAQLIGGSDHDQTKNAYEKPSKGAMPKGW